MIKFPLSCHWGTSRNTLVLILCNKLIWRKIIDYTKSIADRCRQSGKRYETKLNSIIRNEWGFKKSCSRYPRTKNVKKMHLKQSDIRWKVDAQLINIEVKSRTDCGRIYNKVQSTHNVYHILNPITGTTFCYALSQHDMWQLVVNKTLPSAIIKHGDNNMRNYRKYFKQNNANIVALVHKMQEYVFLLTKETYSFFMSRCKNQEEINK